jgi:hypothetical protein
MRYSSRQLSIGSLALGLLVAAAGLYLRLDGFLGNLVGGASGTLIAFFFGYEVFDRKVGEERLARIEPVTEDVVEGAVVMAAAAIRVIAIAAGRTDLAPRIDPAEDASLQPEIDAFAKRVRLQGLALPGAGLNEIAALGRLVQEIVGGIYSLQNAHPFVFAEYPEVAKAIVQVRARMVSVGSAWHWQHLSGRPDPAEANRRATLAYGRLVGALDDVAEHGSRVLERIRGLPSEAPTEPPA